MPSHRCNNFSQTVTILFAAENLRATRVVGSQTKMTNGGRRRFSMRSVGRRRARRSSYLKRPRQRDDDDRGP